MNHRLLPESAFSLISSFSTYNDFFKVSKVIINFLQLLFVNINCKIFFTVHFEKCWYEVFLVQHKQLHVHVLVLSSFISAVHLGKLKVQ